MRHVNFIFFVAVELTLGWFELLLGSNKGGIIRIKIDPAPMHFWLDYTN